MANQPIEPEPPSSVRSGAAPPWDLEGDLERLGLIPVLQFLQSARVDGTVYVQEPDGQSSRLSLLDGVLTGAAYRHLREREAMLAMVGIRAGTFGYVRRAGLASATRLSLNPIIMDAVRLEDDLERISTSLPPSDSPLALRDPHEPPVDPLECQADSVMAAMAARPGATLTQLETLLPLAPIKVRLSVAWMSSTQRLRSKVSQLPPPISRQTNPDDWYQRLLRRSPGGLRILMATSPYDGAHDVIATISSLARAMDAGPAWLSVSADGSSMARVRPKAGGLLSIATVPMSARNTEIFRRFSSTATLVLLCAEAAPELAKEWKAASPSAVPVEHLHCSPRGGCIYNALRRFASSLTPFASNAKLPDTR